MENNLKNALEKIDIPANRKDAILKNVLSDAQRMRSGKTKEKRTMKNKWKYVLAGTGLAACIALTVICIPTQPVKPQAVYNTAAIAATPEVSKSVLSDASFELSVKSENSEQYIKLAVLKNGVKVKTQCTLASDFFAYDKKGKLVGTSGIDFMVKDVNASKVIMESKNYSLDYEDSRNWITDDKKRTWSDYNFTIDLKDLGGNENVSRDEVLAFLKYIQKSDSKKYRTELLQFVDRLYATEERAVSAKAGDVDKFLKGKMKIPIDFNRYFADYKVENDKDKGLDDEFAVVHFVNPDNPPIPRVVGKRIETRSGELVLWTFDWKDMIGKKKSQIDFSKITDEIKITVNYTDGSRQTQTWNIGFDKDGKTVLFCSDVTAKTI